MTATRMRCPQVFENTGFARVCKNFCASRLIPIKRNLVQVAPVCVQLGISNLPYNSDASKPHWVLKRGHLIPIDAFLFETDIMEVACHVVENSGGIFLWRL